MNSLETKNVRRDYIVPDCQVHRYSYDIMQTINQGSPEKGPSGGQVDKPGPPGLDPDDAKEYHYWSDLWKDGGLWEDDL